MNHEIVSASLDTDSHFDYADRRHEYSAVFYRPDLLDPLNQLILGELGDRRSCMLAERGMRETMEEAVLLQGSIIPAMVRTSSLGRQGDAVLNTLELPEVFHNNRSLPFATEGFAPYVIPFDFGDRIETAHRVHALIHPSPENAEVLTLSRMSLHRASSLLDQSRQSPPYHERATYGMDFSYMRGNIYMHEVYTRIVHELMVHHGVRYENNACAFLTSKGIAAMKLSIELIKDLEINGDLYVAGKAYFESHKFFRDIFRNSPAIQQISAAADDIQRHIETSRKNGKSAALFVEPIGSYRDMSVIDLESIVRTAAVLYGDKSGPACYVVIDATTTGGMIPIGKMADIVRESNVRLVITSSLLKFYQLGLDQVQGGCIICLGDGFATNGSNELQLRKLWHRQNAEPDITQVVYMPPILSDVMQIRAKRFDRNAFLIAQALNAACEELGMKKDAVVYPGLQDSLRDSLNYIGFHGAYIFLKLETKKRAAAFVAMAQAASPFVLGSVYEGVSFGHNTPHISRVGSDIRIEPGGYDICSTYFTACRLVHWLENVWNMKE